MGLLSGISEGAKRMIKGWLDITEATETTFTIEERFNFETNAIKNRIWMRGDPIELDQLYKQVNKGDNMFWGIIPSTGNGLRKIHTGLPSAIIKTLTYIVLHDMNDIEVNSEWDKIAEENQFKKLIAKAISNCLFLGDGAFKISFDKTISMNPIIEFYSGNDVEYVYKRGRYSETIFKTYHHYDKKKYMLKEIYGFGYIHYKLYRIDGKHEELVDLHAIPETMNLVDLKFGGCEVNEEGTVIKPGLFNMAVPMKIFESPKWPNRGESIFDSKCSNFDALDEIISQWMDAVRAGRPVTYIPESLIPKDPSTGALLRPNNFDVRFIKTDDNMNENAKNQIDVTQPAIPSDNYLQSYITALDLCLQGIISPSTLGIDTKKLENAEAQREKEKTTLYTRNNIIEVLQDVLPRVINASLHSLNAFNDRPASQDVEVEISFGEYANPSFEAVVETIGKAKTQGIMSIEACVDELYGDSKEDDWKQEEIKRLKSEQGIAEVDEPVMKNPNTNIVNIDDEALS